MQYVIICRDGESPLWVTALASYWAGAFCSQAKATIKLDVRCTSDVVDVVVVSDVNGRSVLGHGSCSWLSDVTVTWRDVIAPDRTSATMRMNLSSRRNWRSDCTYCLSVCPRVIVVFVSFVQPGCIRWRRQSSVSSAKLSAVNIREYFAQHFVVTEVKA